MKVILNFQFSGISFVKNCIDIGSFSCCSLCESAHLFLNNDIEKDKYVGGGRFEIVVICGICTQTVIVLQDNVVDRIRDLISRLIDRDEWRIWEIDVDRVIIHPNYRSSSKFLFFQCRNGDVRIPGS